MILIGGIMDIDCKKAFMGIIGNVFFLLWTIDSFLKALEYSMAHDDDAAEVLMGSTTFLLIITIVMFIILRIKVMDFSEIGRKRFVVPIIMVVLYIFLHIHVVYNESSQAPALFISSIKPHEYSNPDAVLLWKLHIETPYGKVNVKPFTIIGTGNGYGFSSGKLSGTLNIMDNSITPKRIYCGATYFNEKREDGRLSDQVFYTYSQFEIRESVRFNTVDFFVNTVEMPNKKNKFNTVFEINLPETGAKINIGHSCEVTILSDNIYTPGEFVLVMLNNIGWEIRFDYGHEGHIEIKHTNGNEKKYKKIIIDKNWETLLETEEIDSCRGV
jgi:hypothetical protein